MSLTQLVQKLTRSLQETVVENRFIRAATAFSATRIVDTLTTYHIVEEYGVSAERMPVSRFMIESFGVSGLVGFQTAATMAVISFAYYCNKKQMEQVSGTNILYGLTVASGLIALHNLYQARDLFF